jgi:hypothetical protein
LGSGAGFFSGVGFLTGSLATTLGAAAFFATLATGAAGRTALADLEDLAATGTAFLTTGLAALAGACGFLTATVANPEVLDESKSYTIASYGGALTAGFDGDVLPEPWYVYYDWPNKRVQLRAAIGTVFWLR